MARQLAIVLRQLAQRHNTLRQRAGHVVELLREHANLVGAPIADACVEVAISEKDRMRATIDITVSFVTTRVA
jgi:hypothetical protein